MQRLSLLGPAPPSLPPLSLLEDMLGAGIGEIAGAILCFLRQDEALPLRTASRACCAAVAEHPWSDTGSRVRGSLAQWARCFPKARACNLSYNQAFVDNDAALLQGVRTLDCSYCRGFTTAAFVHLRSLRALQMAYCSQPELIDGIFTQLTRGQLRSLDMTGCKQLRSLEGLEGIRSLRMSYVSGVPEAQFAHVRGLRLLDASQCNLSDEALRLIGNGIEELDIENSRHVTDAGLAQVAGELRVLGCGYCIRLTSEAFRPMQRLEVLTAPFVPGVSDEAFQHLRSVRNLNVSYNIQVRKRREAGRERSVPAHPSCARSCSPFLSPPPPTPAQLTDEAFKTLGGGRLRKLIMAHCDSPHITEAALVAVGHSLVELDISYCASTFWREAAFADMPSLRVLQARGLPHLGPSALLASSQMPQLRMLDVRECQHLDFGAFGVVYAALHPACTLVPAGGLVAWVQTYSPTHAWG